VILQSILHTSTEGAYEDPVIDGKLQLKHAPAVTSTRFKKMQKCNKIQGKGGKQGRDHSIKQFSVLYISLMVESLGG